MKRLFTIFATLLATLSLSANNVVTLTVSGQGATKKEATENALRSAIEQAYGVFVSANTIILNDELVRDEIATIASGNIQKYEELSCATMPSGEMLVTLSATVAIDKLQSYAKSHGSTAEFAGQTFAMNMKMRELNKKNEQVALTNMFYHLQELAPHVFDWQLNVGEPVVNGENYEVPMCVTAMANEASASFYNTFIGTLQSLSLSENEVEEYKKIGLETHKIELRFEDKGGLKGNNYCAGQNDLVVVLRNSPMAFLNCYWHFIDAVNNAFTLQRIDGNNQKLVCQADVRPLETIKIIHSKNHISPTLFWYIDFNKFKAPVGQEVFTSEFSVSITPEEMFSTLGFEVSHSKVNCFTFETNCIDGTIETLDIYQNVRRGQYRHVVSMQVGNYPITIKNVNISDDVLCVGEYAFRKRNDLLSINIGNNVRTIDSQAFKECVGTGMDNIILPSSVTYIGEEAFAYSNLKSITIPDGVAFIGKEAFWGCLSLASVYCKATTPPSLDRDAFDNNASGRKIYVPRASVNAYKSASYWSDYKSSIEGYDF